ncbi:hypothetical protein E4T50_04432 [Aureobasidium sp. EXF-12298]|nr:hypothetical protein E4T50_04432 [Aureobasidium sp. EXF-12298]KAI4766066.1 hypothetical protein E4T51_00881 [Aureobasidium sp. EXF-12344]KAI4783579.1 hypothetical protein E4T52_01415 [Aureobasidium sp. EXF-3400]
MTLTDRHPQDEKNKAKRYAKRGVNRSKRSRRVTYEKDVVRNIVDAAPILHVSFNAPSTEDTEPQFPTILPMLGAMSSGTFTDDEQVIYLHGSSAARLFRLGAGQREIGIPIAWTNSRTPPTKSELIATDILRVQIDTASVKVRNGGPHDDKKDLKDDAITSRVWTGVVPVHQIIGEPVASPDNVVRQVPASITNWIEDTNKMRKDQLIESTKE